MVAGNDREGVCALNCEDMAAARTTFGEKKAQSSEAEQRLGAGRPAVESRLSLPRGRGHLGSRVSFLWPP